MKSGRRKRVLILGHPRSGTLYTAVVLRTLGLKVEHEREGEEGSVTGHFWYGTWNLDEYDIILHQVRNPLNVIASCTKMRIRNPKVIKHLVDLGGGVISEQQLRNKVLRYMVTWKSFVDWADSICAWRYRVEDMSDVFPRLCGEFGLGADTIQPAIPTNVNHIEHGVVTYGSMRKLDANLANGIYSKACEYGYETIV